MASDRRCLCDRSRLLAMRSRLSLAILILTATTSHAQFGDIFKKKDPNTASQSSSGSLTNDKITAGLKQALEVSTANAVALTGKPDGFLKNDAIRIPLPDKLQTVSKGLRMIGMSGQVDELEVGMNRAAEQATPKAKAIFLAAVKKMTFDDARGIWSGNDTAATEYFRGASSADLTTAFTLGLRCEVRSRQIRRRQDARRTLLHARPGREEDPQGSRRANHVAAASRLRPPLTHP